jgi:outer membrane protein assembly factor BamB
MVAGLFLAACGIQPSTNWPGMSAVGDRVFISNGPEVVAINIADQIQEWQFPQEPGRAVFLASPSVLDDLVVVGDYGVSKGLLTPGILTTLYAFSELDAAKSGYPEVVWDSPGIANDRIIAAALQTEDSVFVGTADNKFVALDRDDGTVRWEYLVGNSIWSQSTYSDGIVYVTAMDGSVYALDAATGDLVWVVPLTGAVSAKPIVVDGVVFVGSYDAQLHALDAKTGEEQWVADAESWIWGTPSVTDTRVFFADNAGKVIAVERATGEKVWEKDVERPVVARTLEYEGVLYVMGARRDRNDETGGVFAFSAETGDSVWTIETEAPVYSDPVIANGALVVLMQTADGNVLNVFELDSGIQRWSMPLTVTDAAAEQ